MENNNNHWDVVEPCPECGNENVWGDLDPVACDYETVCQHCGEPVMLCDECYHSDDNPYHNCDWHPGIGCKGGICFRRVLKIETYPDMMIDYEECIENPDYDSTIRVFKVSKSWAVEWIRERYGMTYDEFMEEYDWDMTWEMYSDACSDRVLISENVMSRAEFGTI